LANGVSLFDKASVKAATIQAVAASAYTKINLDTVIVDTNSIVDTVNHKITPKRAGYYLVLSGVVVVPSVSASYNVLYKNGALLQAGQDTTLFATILSTLVYFNGTADYIELYVYSTGATNTSVSAGSTIMTVLGPF